jgi:hypothetical protein
MSISLNLSVLSGAYGVCQLDRAAPIPAWATTGDFFAVTRTADELSIVCAQSVIPADVKCESDWNCFKVEGPLDFALTGILASLVSPLSKAGISIFALATYDTDYLMVRHDKFEAALDVLRQAGHRIKEGE